MLPCDVVSLPEFKNQLQSQIQAWAADGINKTRDAARIKDAPGALSPGDNYINNADEKAVELVENAKNCSLPVEQSRFNSNPTSALPVDQDGREGDIGIDPGLASTRDGPKIEQPAGYPGVLDLARRGIRVGSAPYWPSSIAETAAQDPVAISLFSRGDQWSRLRPPSRAPFGWVFPGGRSPWDVDSSDS